jgi:transcriptional regulator of arginine metabolism
MNRRPPKLQRQAVILELVRNERVPSQEVLRELLAERGFEVAQATLSRDLRELGLVKVPDEQGGSVYAVPSHVTDPTPTLERLLPALYLGAEGVGNLLVVKTLTGGAQPVAVAIDWEEWPEVLGTIAGDDTILLILREGGGMQAVVARLEELAGM